MLQDLIVVRGGRRAALVSLFSPPTLLWGRVSATQQTGWSLSFHARPLFLSPTSQKDAKMTEALPCLWLFMCLGIKLRSSCLRGKCFYLLSLGLGICDLFSQTWIVTGRSETGAQQLWEFPDSTCLHTTSFYSKQNVQALYNFGRSCLVFSIPTNIPSASFWMLFIIQRFRVQAYHYLEVGREERWRTQS